MNVLREACTALTSQVPRPRHRAQLTSHITIPAAYRAGITLFVRSDMDNNGLAQELFQVPDLELLEPDLELLEMEQETADLPTETQDEEFVTQHVDSVQSPSAEEHVVDVSESHDMCDTGQCAAACGDEKDDDADSGEEEEDDNSLSVSCDDNLSCSDESFSME